MLDSALRKIRRVAMPHAFRGKPFRRIQREYYQRVYHYPHRNLLAIGQQKSGSTWLLRMLCDIPGYLRWTPNNIKFEKADLRLSDFVPPAAGYTVTKVHTPPTQENLDIIRATNRPYVVLIRDLRDICVSFSHYVHITPDHPRHDITQGMTIPQTIDYFINEMLQRYADWQGGWIEHIHPAQGLLIRYEDLLADPHAGLARLLDHYQITLKPEEARAIIDRHSFKRATGRAPGQEDNSSFNRKGVAGDWRNHFTPEHRAAFLKIAGSVMRRADYDLSEMD